MHITAFLARNHISLSRPALDSCLEAIDRMYRSTDPFHNETHVFSILDSLDIFLSENSQVKNVYINFDILLQAVCWHDVWKSVRTHKNTRALIFHNVAEGLGSMRIYSRYAKGVKINKSTTTGVRYAIRKHSSLQFFPKNTLESRILYDLDNLEVFSFERLSQAIANFGGLENISPKLIHVGHFYFNHWMAKKTGSKLYFDWSRKQFQIRKEKFIASVAELIRNYTRTVGSHPTASSVLRDINENQASRNLKIILKGASKIKSNTNTRKLSLDTPRLNILPTATIGSNSISPREDPSSRGGLYE